MLSISLKFKKRAFFQEPDEEDTIWRYMSLSRFVSMLQNKALWFARLDKLEDEYEGRVPYRAFERLKPITQAQYFNQRENTAINCWCCFESESLGLWNTYLRGTEGIAVKSTFGRLRNSFVAKRDLIRREVHIGKVRYVDFESFDLSELGERRSEFSFTLRKRKLFAYESELRAVTRIGYGPGISDVSGFMAPVELRTLLVSVHVAPKSSPLLKEVISRLLVDHGLDADLVSASSLELPLKQPSSVDLILFRLRHFSELHEAEMAQLREMLHDREDYLPEIRKRLPRCIDVALEANHRFVGVAHWSAKPVRLYIWIHPRERQRGFANKTIDQLCKELRKLGITQVDRPGSFFIHCFSRDFLFLGVGMGLFERLRKGLGSRNDED